MNSDQECTTFVGTYSLGLISQSNLIIKKWLMNSGQECTTFVGNFNHIEMVHEFWPRMHNICR